MKKSLSILLAIIIAFSMVSFSGITAFAADSSGKCGTGVNWKYTESNKTLTISGDNIMDDYSKTGNSYNRPWEKFIQNIECVVINEGVLSVGDYAFVGCTNLKDVTIADTVLVIGEGAFQSCTSLVHVNAGKNVMAIGPSAFENCTSFSIVKISKETVYIGDNAFAGCSDINVIYTGLKPQLDYIYYEDASEKFKGIWCADTVYDFVVEVDYYDVFTVVSDQPFELVMDVNDAAEILETQYEVVSEGGIDYYVGGVAILGKDNGRTVLYAVDNEGYVLNTFTILVGCVNNHWVTDEGRGKKATCSDYGFDISVCGECGHVETFNYHYGQHEVTSYKVVQPATCNEFGIEKGQCKLCGEWIERQLMQIDHTWSEWVVTIEPTVEKEGEMVQECIYCGKKMSSYIPPINNIKGDVDGDRNVSAKDARLVLQYVAGIREFNEFEFSHGDVNGDGNVTAIDARFILQKVAGIIA